MWFALTQPPYGTSMPQSGRRPQHQKRLSANLLRQVWFDVASGHLGYRLVLASTASSTAQQISNGNLLSASSGRHLLSRRCVRIFGSEGPTPSNPLPQIPAASVFAAKPT